jgi:hypothetical protein
VAEWSIKRKRLAMDRYKLSSNFNPRKKFSHLNSHSTNPSEIKTENDVSKKVSPKKYTVSWLRLAPNVLRIPISLDFLIASAVARLMKLIQAITRINVPNNPIERSPLSAFTADPGFHGTVDQKFPSVAEDE